MKRDFAPKFCIAAYSGDATITSEADSNKSREASRHDASYWNHRPVATPSDCDLLPALRAYIARKRPLVPLSLTRFLHGLQSGLQGFVALSRSFGTQFSLLYCLYFVGVLQIDWDCGIILNLRNFETRFLWFNWKLLQRQSFYLVWKVVILSLVKSILCLYLI